MSEDTHSSECSHYLGSLSDFIDGELRDELCAEIEKHMHECEKCRIVVDTLRKTVELYEQCGEQAELPETVRERLFYKLELAEFLKES